MKVNILIVKDMVKAFILFLIVVAMKDNFIMNNLISKVFTLMLMIVVMKVNILMVKDIIKAFILWLVVIAIKTNRMKTKIMVKELI